MGQAHLTHGYCLSLLGLARQKQGNLTIAEDLYTKALKCQEADDAGEETAALTRERLKALRNGGKVYFQFTKTTATLTAWRPAETLQLEDGQQQQQQQDPGGTRKRRSEAPSIG